MACSIARTFDVAGEPWSPLIVRDVWVGINRFDQLQSSLGVSSKVLAERLKWLTDHEILHRRAYSARPVRYEYLLTERGREFCEVLMVIMAWGDRWTTDETGPPVFLRHSGCGHLAQAEIRCSSCGDALHVQDVEVEPGPGALSR
jgi:DNA-binding HxlR family transcriptional regulator